MQLSCFVACRLCRWGVRKTDGTGQVRISIDVGGSCLRPSPKALRYFELNAVKQAALQHEREMPDCLGHFQAYYDEEAPVI